MNIGLARVSKVDQNEELQINALQNYGCKKIFTDKCSAYQKDRPGLIAALDFLREGDTLVVWKLDRLGRSIGNLTEISSLLSRKGVHLVSLTEKIDTSTPSGKLYFNISASYAQFERDVLIERTNEGLLAAKRRGTKLGRRSKFDKAKFDLFTQLLNQKNKTVSEIERLVNMPKCSYYRYKKQLERETIAK